MSKPMATPRWTPFRCQWPFFSAFIAWKSCCSKNAKSIVCAIALLVFVIAALQVMLPDHEYSSLDVGSDDLLLKISELTREGGDLLCDASIVEKKLAVRIQRPSVDKGGDGFFFDRK